jgi:cysteine protease ATG4
MAESEFEFEHVASEQEELPWRNSVLVIVSNRFGIKDVNQNYFPVIKRYMKLDSFVGLVGGKPRFAYYFVGHMEKPAGVDRSKLKRDESDRLIFLDPHFVSPQVDPLNHYEEDSSHFHCN